MAQPFGPKSTIDEQTISAAKVDHLPIVKHYAQRLGLVEIVNRLVPTKVEVRPGVIVLGMVLDTLSGRSPLYHLEESFEDCDRGLLFGEALAASYFNDDNVGRVLELLYEVGTQKIFSSVSVAALQRFSLSTEHVHFDTTSVNLYGDYPNAADEGAPFEITHVYSVDAYHIPLDLRQLLDDTRFWIEHKTYEPYEIAARFHHRLVQIHPFPNGNGRHARLTTDLLLTALGQPRFTWGSVNLVDAGETRKAYVTALRAADNHDMRPLLEFVRS